jgi:sporulation protein YlmC with PRC-barrel domain
LLGLATPCQAEAPGKLDMESAELAAELIGAPVLAGSGEQVGEVADLSFDDEGQPLAIRVKTAAHLGLGVRRVQIPKGAFIALRGAIVLQIPAEALGALTEVTEPDDEK